MSIKRRWMKWIIDAETDVSALPHTRAMRQSRTMHVA